MACHRTVGSVPKWVPLKAHPLARILFSLMWENDCTYGQLATRAGVQWQTIFRWRSGRPPDLSGLEACLNVLGHRIGVVRVAGPRRSTVPRLKNVGRAQNGGGVPRPVPGRLPLSPPPLDPR